MEISIALATFNGERYLRDQLDSLIAQTHLPLEIVVCDDGSDDATLSIIDDVASKSKVPIHVVLNSARLGWRENFTKAIGLCRGELVAFCDQDDVWLPRKLELCKVPFIDSEVMLCVHRALATNASLVPIYPVHQSIRSTKILSPLEGDPFRAYLGFSQVFRKTLFNIIEPSLRPRETLKPEHQFAHDIWLSFLGFCFGKTALINKNLVLYRQHGNQATSFGSRLNSKNSLLPLERIRFGMQMADRRFDDAIDFSRQCSDLLRNTKLDDKKHRQQAEKAADLFETIIKHQRIRQEFIEQHNSKIARTIFACTGLLRNLYGEYKIDRKVKEALKDIILPAPGSSLKRTAP
jgi:glycosyltransferase involved in cell wall biosynthesis